MTLVQLNPHLPTSLDALLEDGSVAAAADRLHITASRRAEAPAGSGARRGSDPRTHRAHDAPVVPCSATPCASRRLACGCASSRNQAPAPLRCVRGEAVLAAGANRPPAPEIRAEQAAGAHYVIVVG